MPRLNPAPKKLKPQRQARPFDPRLRYYVWEAAHHLAQSEPQTWVDIRKGRLPVIREGKRTFVCGAGIAARCGPAA